MEETQIMIQTMIPIIINKNLQLILETVNHTIELIDCYMVIQRINPRTSEHYSIRLTYSEFIVFTKFVESHWSFHHFETVPTFFIEDDLQFTYYDDFGFSIIRRSKSEKSIYLNDKDLESMELYFPGLILMMNEIKEPPEETLPQN